MQRNPKAEEETGRKRWGQNAICDGRLRPLTGILERASSFRTFRARRPRRCAVRAQAPTSRCCVAAILARPKLETVESQEKRGLPPGLAAGETEAEATEGESVRTDETREESAERRPGGGVATRSLGATGEGGSRGVSAGAPDAGAPGSGAATPGALGEPAGANASRDRGEGVETCG